ncbi:MAG TPA: threonine--tRNA ligase [Candidatus Acidoferrales bacterium]|nr:threonine--tRNA ligase [Candidatus Acidoferrales bacterium]
MSDHGGLEESEQPNPLHMLRHSAAHLLAAAATELYPGVKYAIGPPVENGFYYDFEFPQPVGEGDLPRIAKKMAELVRRRIPFEQLMLPRAEARERFAQLGQDFKLEILEREAAADTVVSCYATGAFLDLCRGPHVPHTGELAHFKLLRVAGAYWRGDEKNPQLTRIYGTAWPTREALDAHLAALAMAEQRDHKRLGPEMQLFKLDERTGVGNVIWLPNGATIRRQLERWVVDEELARGYEHVITPVVAKLDLYRQSGHWARYQDSMYPPMRTEEGVELELRPMNCPHHILVYESEPRSYRDLPVRIAEVGTNFRWEKSGELMGMIRVRSFALDDAHIFCTTEQLGAEIGASMLLARHFMETLGISGYSYRLSVRDKEKSKYAGGDEQWEAAEAALVQALQALGVDYTVGRGEAAFYGPKIDFQVRDAQLREFTNSTVQVDFYLPECFDLGYTAQDGSRQRPVMVHRGAFGALERMTAYLIEHFGGAFPTWLAPVQVFVLPITDAQNAYAEEITQALRAHTIRVRLDSSSERLGKKIRSAQRLRPPYMLILGAAETESRTVSVRIRGGEERSLALDEFIQSLLQDVAERRLQP